MKRILLTMEYEPTHTSLGRKVDDTLGLDNLDIDPSNKKVVLCDLAGRVIFDGNLSGIKNMNIPAGVYIKREFIGKVLLNTSKIYIR